MGVDFADLTTPVLFSMDAATNRLRVTATITGTVATTGTITTEPVFKFDPTSAAEAGKYGKLDTDYSLYVGSRFKRIAKAEPAVGEELRFDDISAGDLYIGAAVALTATATAIWSVVKYSRTATGVITRCQFKDSIAWDNRTTAGNWA